MAETNPIQRREVLRAAAILPMGMVAGTAANSAVKVGVIGTGGRGQLDARLLQESTDARITAISDIQPERMERAKKEIPLSNPEVFEDYRDLLASDVDAVIIATPVFLHPEHLEAAVKAGKHVYIEKPAATDIEGCKRVMRVADAAPRNINISFGFQQRYGPGYRRAKALLDSGDAGALRFAQSYWIKGIGRDKRDPGPVPSSLREKSIHWKLWRETFGDYIVETYCHGVDVLNWFAGGHPNSAIGSAGNVVFVGEDMRDHVNVTFHYPNRVDGVLTGTQIAPTFYRDVREVFLCAREVLETSRNYMTRHKGKTDSVTQNEPRDITADGLAAFVRRIKTGRPENVGVRSAESTLTAIMARMAMDLKREVTWEEVMRS